MGTMIKSRFTNVHGGGGSAEHNISVWEALYHSIPLWLPPQHLSFRSESFLCFTSSLQLEAGAGASTAGPPLGHFGE